MEKTQINNLIDKYIQGKATVQELELLQTWYRETGYEDTKYPGFETEVQDRVFSRLQGAINPVRENRLWPRIAVAVSIAVAVAAGMYFSTPDLHFGGRGSNIALTTDISPGKNKASLTLADGKTIALSELKTGVVIATSKLTYNDGTVLSARSRQEGSLNIGRGEGMLTMATPRGGIYQVVLPDGSKVWLNAASSISFPASFSGLVRREVELIGEAYFEIYHNDKQPFKVICGKMELTALGTNFNVNAYEDEPAVTATMLAGSLQVSSPGAAGTVLKPNQQAFVANEATGSPSPHIKNVDAKEFIAWKNGLFYFKEARLETVMRQLSRWYDVDIAYEDKAAMKETFGGSVSRYDDVSGILNAISLTGVAKFKIEGKKIIVIN